MRTVTVTKSKGKTFMPRKSITGYVSIADLYDPLDIQVVSLILVTRSESVTFKIASKLQTS
jgi:hypothetical protein